MSKDNSVKDYKYTSSNLANICMVLLVFASLTIGTGNPMKPSAVGILFCLYYVVICFINSNKIGIRTLIINSIVLTAAIATFISNPLGMRADDFLMAIFYYLVCRAGIAIVLSLTLIVSILATIIKTNNHVNRITHCPTDETIYINPSKITHILLSTPDGESEASSDEILRTYKDVNPEIADYLNNHDEIKPEVSFCVFDNSFVADGMALSRVKDRHRKLFNIPFAHSLCIQPGQLALDGKNYKIIIETVISSGICTNLFTKNAIKPIAKQKTSVTQPTI